MTVFPYRMYCSDCRVLVSPWLVDLLQAGRWLFPLNFGNLGIILRIIKQLLHMLEKKSALLHFFIALDFFFGCLALSAASKA